MAMPRQLYFTATWFSTLLLGHAVNVHCSLCIILVIVGCGRVIQTNLRKSKSHYMQSSRSPRIRIYWIIHYTHIWISAIWYVVDVVNRHVWWKESRTKAHCTNIRGAWTHCIRNFAASKNGEFPMQVIFFFGKRIGRVQACIVCLVCVCECVCVAVPPEFVYARTGRIKLERLERPKLFRICFLSAWMIPLNYL